MTSVYRRPGSICQWRIDALMNVGFVSDAWPWWGTCWLHTNRDRGLRPTGSWSDCGGWGQTHGCGPQNTTSSLTCLASYCGISTSVKLWILVGPCCFSGLWFRVQVHSSSSPSEDQTRGCQPAQFAEYVVVFNILSVHVSSHFCSFFVDVTGPGSGPSPPFLSRISRNKLRPWWSVYSRFIFTTELFDFILLPEEPTEVTAVCKVCVIDPGSVIIVL